MSEENKLHVLYCSLSVYFYFLLFSASYYLHILTIAFSALCLQCFDAVGWAAGRASGL